MKSRILTCMTAMTLLSALAIPAQLSAQANAAQGLAYTVLYTFTGTDGSGPYAGLIQDEKGNLYSTTWVGSDLSGCSGFGYGCGVVFKVDPKGNETVLYTFTGGVDGATPFSDVVRDEAGNLYGTTTNFWGGSSPFGTVFKLDPAGKETVLYSFTGGADGNEPFSGLVRDTDGNLYGTTAYGGDLSACFGGGCGVVFKLDPTDQETVLYTFTAGADGAYPLSSGDLVRDEAGNLYGTAASGGDLSACVSGYGCGVVFKVDPTGKETVLYSFTGTPDGQAPEAGLLRDEEGNLYGTAEAGGASGHGAVFK